MFKLLNKCISEANRGEDDPKKVRGVQDLVQLVSSLWRTLPLTLVLLPMSSQSPLGPATNTFLSTSSRTTSVQTKRSYRPKWRTR